MSDQPNPNEEKPNLLAFGALVALWTLCDSLGQRQAYEDARTDRFIDSIDRISRWF